MPTTPTSSLPSPDKPQGSASRAADSSEARPAAPRPPVRKSGTHEPARPASDPQRVRNDGDSRRERGGGLAQGDERSQRDPDADASQTATNTGGAPTGKARR